MVKMIIFLAVTLVLTVLVRFLFANYLNKSYATFVVMLVMTAVCAFEGILALSDTRLCIAWMLWGAVLLVIWLNTLISIVKHNEKASKAEKSEEKPKEEVVECKEIELREGTVPKQEEPKVQKVKVKVKKVNRTVDK